MQNMDTGAKGWLLRTAHKHYWRVASWMEFEDLIQDGYLHYARIANKYREVKDPPQIMALFKRTYINHLHDISKKRTKQIDVAISSIVSDEHVTDFFERNGGEDDDFSNLLLAPELVKATLFALSRPSAIKVLRSRYRKYADGTRETTNERLCRLVGLDPSMFSLHSVLRSYLIPAV